MLRVHRGSVLVAVCLAAVPVGSGRTDESPMAAKQMAAAALGDPLPAGAVARLGTGRMYCPHRGPRVALSPGGKVVVSAEDDRAIRLWEATTGIEQKCIPMPQEKVTALGFVTDSRLVTGEADGWVRVWDLAALKEVRKWRASDSRITSVVVAGGGRLMGSFGNDGTFRLWELATGKELRQIKGPPLRTIGEVALSADGMTLAARVNWRRDPAVPGLPALVATPTLYDTSTGKELRQLPDHAYQDHEVQSLAFAPDGRTLATADGPRVRLWDVATAKEVRQWLAPELNSGPLVFAPGGKSLMVGDRLWNAETGKNIEGMVLPRGCRAAGGGAFTADGRVVALLTGAKILLWDLAGGRPVHPCPGHHYPVNKLCFSPDGKVLATGDERDGLRLWDTSRWTEERQVQAGRPLAFSADGKVLFARRHWENVRRWDVATGKDLGEVPGIVTRRWELPILSGDRRLLAQVEIDGKVHVYALGEKHEARLLRTMGLEVVRGNRFDAVAGRPTAFSPDNKHLACLLDDGGTALCEVATGKVLARLGNDPRDRAPAGDPPKGGVHHAIFTPDGKVLAAGTTNNADICLYDVETGRVLGRFPSNALVGQLAFTPDGKTLVSRELGHGAPLRLWEVATRKERGTFPHDSRMAKDRDPLHALALSPDGRLLATGSADTTVVVWEVGGQPGK